RTSFSGGRRPAGRAARLTVIRDAVRCPTRRDANHPPDREKELHMAVLDRSELEASPLADLHAIADQLGLDGFRRLRKADLINAILGEPAGTLADGDRSREEPDGDSETGSD